MKKKTRVTKTPTFTASSGTPQSYTNVGKNTWGSTTTTSGYLPYPYGEQFCDCDQRCPKCGKRKRPHTIGPVWCCQ